MKREMTIEYLKCRAYLNFDNNNNNNNSLFQTLVHIMIYTIIEVDFGVNGAIGTIVTKCDLVVFG